MRNHVRVISQNTALMKKLFLFLILIVLLFSTLFMINFTKAHASATFTYGQHFPNGNAAVTYINGANGMWKNNDPSHYNWNYYTFCATPGHPYDKTSLINAANGTAMYVAADANCHLLLDFNHDGEIDTTAGGFAYHEHNGKGVGGAAKGNPFTNFWYDDNMLARYMTNAYGTTAPNGLSLYSNFTRWQILGGDTSNWTPYGSNFTDTLALDGMYYLSSGNVSTAVSKWNTILSNSGSTYDSGNQQYNYPNITENYHLGLFKVLTDNLMDNASVSSAQRTTMLQHSVSLRSHILSNQEKDGSGNLLGWISNIGVSTALINTESIAANVIALGANAKYAYEAGKAPLSMNNNNYFVRPYNALSAVHGLSTAGYMTYGPYKNLPTGSYTVEFFLRAPSPANGIATLDVRDNNNSTILATHSVQASEMNTGNQWSKIALTINVTNASNSLEFRTNWGGGNNMDVALIRIR